MRPVAVPAFCLRGTVFVTEPGRDHDRTRNPCWNAGDAAAFLADFSDDGELVDFEESIHKGRDELIAFHRPRFGMVLKGARLVRGEVKFALIVRPGWAWRTTGWPC